MLHLKAHISLKLYGDIMKAKRANVCFQKGIFSDIKIFFSTKRFESQLWRYCYWYYDIASST